MRNSARGDSPDLSAASWQQRYDDRQTGWDRGEPSPALLKWLDAGELQTGRVLVPGCGFGHEVIELASRAFDVTAIDFAKSAIRALTKQLDKQGLRADVIQESVLNYVSKEPFDAIYEQTCLCAISPRQRTDYERILHACLKNGGRLFALFMQTDASGGPPFHCDLQAMKELFPGERWSWSREQFTLGHPSGMKEVAFILTKTED